MHTRLSSLGDYHEDKFITVTCNVMKAGNLLCDCQRIFFLGSRMELVTFPTESFVVVLCDKYKDAAKDY
ncbi:Hypothetical predicted protein [Octopus vulgaris]|uniref:Uncharacterized protein n=1 Tax=Octopus vulgaris TaxID=6645 RepID=A0AA36AML8_OCTVU|nr:Hypothetical predicted protein [Octopus vulgaris]